MKKLYYLLFVLLTLYFSVEISFINFNKGHELEYKIKHNDKLFYIKEIYSQKRKEEINNYYFEIKVDNNLFNYQTFKNYKKENYIIKKIDYFESDNYKCINIKTKKNESISDLICLDNNNIQYFYSTIKGNDKLLDQYASLNKIKKSIDNKKNKIDADPVILYTDNLLDKHYVSLLNYKGVYLINKKDKIKNIKLFENDIYNNRINVINNKFFLTADYNNEYKFHEMYLINIKNGKKDKVISNDNISIDSYINGSVDNEVYLFDKSEKKQYRINTRDKTVSLSGNTSKGITVYTDNKYKVASAYDAYDSNIYFSRYSTNEQIKKYDYVKIDKVGNKLSGYIYIYKKNGKKYDIYRCNIQNKSIFTYIAETDDYNNVSYYKDFIYFKNDLYLKYYQDELGIKTLLKNSEFEFNKTINFGLYVD